MKLKYILTALLASFILFGCEDQFKLYLDEVQVSSSYIGIPKSGGQTTITITATESWSINGIPSWLTVTPANGSAGETSVTFKANYTDNNNKVTLSLICGEGEQYINVVQGVEPPPVSPIKDILKDGKPGTIYRAEGKVSGIYNTQYGNWYLVDNEGNELLIYGTLDKNGTTKNFSSLGINNDDIVVVEGPLTIYNGTYELVDVTVLSHIKTLVKLFSEPESITRDGGDFIVELDLKGSGLIVNIPSAAQSWLHYSGNQTIYDEKRDKDVTVAYFSADANNGGVRSANITFSTKNTDPKDNMVYSATTNIIQEGNLTGKGTKNEPYTIDDVQKLFAANAYNSEKVYVAGYITSIKEVSVSYGNAGYYVADAKGETTDNSLYVYRGYYLDGSKFTSEDQIKVNGEVVLEGVIGQYNGALQFTNSSIVSYVAPGEAAKGTLENPYSAAEAKTAAALLGADETSNDVYVKGTISYIKEVSVSYGNATYYISIDGKGNEGNSEGEFYIYRGNYLNGAKFDKEDLIKVGDTVLLLGKLANYKGNSPQLNQGSKIISIN